MPDQARPDDLRSLIMGIVLPRLKATEERLAAVEHEVVGEALRKAALPTTDTNSSVRSDT